MKQLTQIIISSNDRDLTKAIKQAINQALSVLLNHSKTINFVAFNGSAAAGDGTRFWIDSLQYVLKRDHRLITASPRINKNYLILMEMAFL